MLEHSAVANHLLSLGLLEPSAAVDEDLTVVDRSRRNCVFIATASGGAALVVKQGHVGSVDAIAHEATVLRILGAEPGLADQVPTVVQLEAADARLILRTPPNGRDWSALHRARRLPRAPARMLGRALATLHRLDSDRVGARPAGFDPMWVLSLPEPPSDLLVDLSSGAEDLVALLQASPTLCDHLRTLRETCADDCVVHGDIRWENCLMVAPPGSQRRTRLLLVDWEFAGPGHSAFDVGAALGEYLRLWVGSIPIVEPGDPGRLVSQARHPLVAIQPAMEAYWTAYRRARAAGPRLTRVVQFAAVRLVQAALEHAQRLAAPSARVLSLVQLADNMLRHPDDAARHLLALRE